MERAAVSDTPEKLSRKITERKSSIGGYTYATADSTPGSSAMSEKQPEPIGRNDIQVEMTMLMMQRAQKEGLGAHNHPSVASFGSSVWSSSGNSIEGSDDDSNSFAWSTSLNSEELSSDFSSSYSGSDAESSSEEEEDEDQVPEMGQKKYPQPPQGMMTGPNGVRTYPQPPPGMMGGMPGEKQYPQPPPGMMEGLPLGMGGLPLSLESLKRDLEKVGRAILASNAGEIAIERAGTLASINWLASHVPNAVLDQLGHETRELIGNDGKDESTNDESIKSTTKRRGSIVESDAMSDVSDLSQEHLNEAEFEEELNPSFDVADVGDVTHSYGDLANFRQPQNSNGPGRPPNTVDPQQPTEPKKGVKDNLPNEHLGEENLPGGIPLLLSPRRLPPTGKKANVVKGIFKRLTKRGAKKSHGPELESLELRLGESDRQSEGTEEEEGSEHSLSIEEGTSQSASKELEVKTKIRGKRLPYSSEYRCSLLFVDISGFTKLSTKLDPESLSKAINSYFQLIVDVVLKHKGDLLKFAGDAVFIEWKASHEVNLESCVESAVVCGAEIVSRCSDFSVLENGANDTECLVDTTGAAKIDTLNVHCGVGAGQMVGVHVGDHLLRREYLLLGQPIQQATVATDVAQLGEVAVSPEAHALLTRVSHLDKDVAKINDRPAVVLADRTKSKFSSRKRMGSHLPKIVNDVSRGVTKHVEGLENNDLKKYRRMMSLYVHPVVVDNDLAAAANMKQIKKIEKSAQERHREEAEIRNVFVMFVNPKVETKVTKNEKTNREMYKTLNAIMNASSREIKRYNGHLRQFIVDDKGLVLIITFGLRGTQIPNLVSQRALPATISIHSAIQNDLGIPCRVGATIGEAYCGVVGGVKRHEYAVLGPSVNLAARLMASSANPGIVVDHNVRMLAHRSFCFNALPPVHAKGYAEPVPIFEPLSILERSWGKLQPNFVGRKDEIVNIMGIARDMVLEDAPSRLVIVQGKSGMGKSTMVAHCIEHVRKLMGAHNLKLIVTKNVSRESDALIPFGVFRSILRDVLQSFRASHEDRSLPSLSMNQSCSSLAQSIAYESLANFSSGQSTAMLSKGKSADVIQSLCRELDMSPSFADYIMQSLLGLEKRTSSGTLIKTKPPSPKTMVTFMSRAFKRCTQHARLVVVALDDLHEADEYSWKAIREIYETTHNVLFIGTTYPEDSRNMKVEEDFWGDLTNKYRKAGRFLTMGLGPLNRDEITVMIMKSLGMRRKEVKDDVLQGVTIQSGGFPHFVNEILEHVKEQMAKDPEFEISDLSYESFGDLVLQRLDNFDLTTRNMLNIGGVIGLSFTLNEVVAVQMRTSDSNEDTVKNHAEEALQVAVDGGILQCTEINVDNESDLGNSTKKYAFYHAVWRTALLNLMLEGRKRDLHRSIAETLESKDNDLGDYMLNTRLFNHWVCCHNFEKAAELALEVGRHFEERLGLPAQSIRLYNDSLDLLRENKIYNDSLDVLREENDDRIGGFSTRVFEEATATDLAYIIRLQVALGKSLATAQRMTDSVTAYQDALRITQATKSSKQLEDRSILFPVFIGLSQALKRGHIIQDADCKYEKAMLRRYVQEAKIHGDPINALHAMSLQADMFARYGEYENAIDVQKKEIEPLYDIEAHSHDLCDEHESDLGAQSFSNSALWNWQLGRTDEATGIGWFVVEELMPKTEKRNVHSSFLILYPTLWVLKESGFSLEARDIFDEYVCEAYTEYFGEGRSTFFLPLYDPVMMLLDLAGNADTDEDMMDEYIDWAIDVDNLGFGTLINSKTGEMGRTADSIAAEICYILAQQVKDEGQKATLIENGIEIATEDYEFTKEKKLSIAQLNSAKVLEMLRSLDE